jgi:hypothetical protein
MHLIRKIEAIRRGEYDFWDQLRNHRKWANHLHGIMEALGPDGTEAAARGVDPCDVVESASAASRAMHRTEPDDKWAVALTSDEWIEIFCALDDKVYDIRNGRYEEGEDDREFLNEWADQLERITETIGPNGKEAAARGVEPCDMPKRSNAESPGPITIGRIQ